MQNSLRNSDEVVNYFLKGVFLYQQSQLLDAKSMLEKVIEGQPTHFEALHLLGVIAAQSNDLSIALDYFSEAIKANPNHILSLTNMGLILQSLGKFEQARKIFSQLISINPRFADAYYHLGNVYKDLNQIDKALDSYNCAITIKPSYPEALNNRGNALKALNRSDEALSSYEQAIRLNKNYAQAHYNRGNLLQEKKQLLEALSSYELALMIDSNYFEAFYNRGLILHELNRYDEALTSYDQAISIKLNYLEAYTNRGYLLKELKLYEQALASFDEALKVKPNYPEAQLGKALLHLLSKQFEEGWAYYNARWVIIQPFSQPIISNRPFWCGESGGIYIWQEQGLGDEILYASMFHDLSTIKNKKIISADVRLLPLYKRSFVDLEFVAKDQLVSESQYEFQIPIGDLGKFFRPNIESFKKSKNPYLFADDERVKKIKARINKDNQLVCGLSWNSINEKLGKKKSLDLKSLESILNLPSFKFINLQYGDTSFEINSLSSELQKKIFTFEDLDLFNDLDGLAALIQACDVVLTISNVTAHLAGALGSKVILLLPFSKGRQWYWFEGDKKSLIYPEINIISQKSSGDWSEVIQSAKIDLESMYVRCD